MHQRPQPTPSYLFTVRLWWEDLGQGQTELRGIVKLVSSGEEHYFRDWMTLGRLLEGMLPSLPAATPVVEEGGRLKDIIFAQSALKPT